MGSFNVDDYTTVADRIEMLKEDMPDSRIITTRIADSIGGDIEIFRAMIFRDKQDQKDKCPLATGYAQEVRDTELKVSNNGYEYESVNYTSWLENCETSAIGRALANIGYTGDGGRPSREEMQKVQRMQEKAKDQPSQPKSNGSSKTKKSKPKTSNGTASKTNGTTKSSSSSNGQAEGDKYRQQIISEDKTEDLIVWYKTEKPNLEGKKTLDLEGEEEVTYKELMAEKLDELENG